MNAPLPADARPRLGRLFRFQWEPVQQAHVLLYPEGMVKLNGSAGEILLRCDGQRRADEIVAELERAFERNNLQGDVLGMLSHAQEKDLIR